MGLAGCNSPRHLVHGEPSNGFGYIFDGFVYMGVDVDPKEHISSGLEMPHRILTNHDYVFHHSSPFDETAFARTSLPQRLERLGFTVTKAVDAEQGFVAVGPVNMWFVRFERGSCSGSIGNRVCLDLTKRRLFRTQGWEPSDYILSLHGSCIIESADGMQGRVESTGSSASSD